MSIAAEALGQDTFQAVCTGYVQAARSSQTAAARARAVAGFVRAFATLTRRTQVPVTTRLAPPRPAKTFAAFAAVYTQTPVDAGYVVASGTYWGPLQAERYPETVAEFHTQATSLGFTDHETARMWARVSQIAVIAGTAPAQLTPTGYATARAALHTAMTQRRGHLPRTLSTPLFGLDAVMFHRGQASPPPPKTRPLTPPGHIDWDQISPRAPVLAATMARYLRQLSLSLRPGSVALVETTLRQLARMLVTDHPHVHAVADIDRAHIEAYKATLAARAGYRGRPSVSKTTIGMRLGHLRGFFDRIIEWAYPDAPTRNPVYRSDTPIKDRPLPRFLDDDQASALMAAARALPDPLDRLIVIVLARTGMRKGELLGLTVDATPSCRSAPATGYAPPSASCTPTGTSPYTRS